MCRRRVRQDFRDFQIFSDPAVIDADARRIFQRDGVGGIRAGVMGIGIYFAQRGVQENIEKFLRVGLLRLAGLGARRDRRRQSQPRPIGAIVVCGGGEAF